MKVGLGLAITNMQKAGVSDSTAPTVTLVEVQAGGLTVDVTFSEAMGTGVTTASNYTLSGTGKGTLATNPNSVALVSGNKYRCTWTSGDMFNGGNITIAVANAQDLAGNAVNSSGTHTGGAIGHLPSVVITSSETSPSTAATIPLTITFSEAVTGFVVGDITVVGCTLGALSGSGASYTVTATPTAYTMTVDIAASVCIDAAGNNNTAATQFTMIALSKWYLAGGISAANCTRAYQALGAADLASSYSNLPTPGTGDATVPVAAPTFNTLTGWTFNGTSQNLDSGQIPGSGHTMLVMFSKNITDGKVVCGAFDTDRFHIFTYTSTNRRYDYGNNFRTVAGARLWGTMAIAGVNCYVDGVADGTVSASFAGGNTRSIWIGDINYSSHIRYAGDVMAFAYYNTTLSAGQISAIDAALNLLPQRYVWLEPIGFPTITTFEQHGFEVCNNKFYVVGGASKKKLFEYDPATRIWTAKTDVPFAATEHQSAIFRAVGTKLYFIGGYNSGTATYYGNVYEFDTNTGTWAEKTAMPTVREDMGSAVVNGKIYVFGGITTGATPTSVMEIYNPADDTWDTTKAALPVAKLLGDFGCACNGKIYAIGAAASLTGSPNYTAVSTVYSYDPDTNIWTTKTPMSAGTSSVYKECEVLGNKIYVVAGAKSNYNTAHAEIYIYDTVLDSWSQNSFDAPYAAAGAALAVYNNKIYMTGGNPNHSDFYKLNL